MLELKYLWNFIIDMVRHFVNAYPQIHDHVLTYMYGTGRVIGLLGYFPYPINTCSCEPWSWYIYEINSVEIGRIVLLSIYKQTLVHFRSIYEKQSSRWILTNSIEQ